MGGYISQRIPNDVTLSGILSVLHCAFGEQCCRNRLYLITPKVQTLLNPTYGIPYSIFYWVRNNASSQFDGLTEDAFMSGLLLQLIIQLHFPGLCLNRCLSSGFHRYINGKLRPQEKRGVVQSHC